MAYLTKDQVREIVKNAPDKSTVIDDLVKRGHTLEGYAEVSSDMPVSPRTQELEPSTISQDNFFQRGKAPLVGGLAGKALDFLTQSEQRFGETIAGTLLPLTKESKELQKSRAVLSDLQNQVIQKIKEKQARGEDVSRLLNTLKTSNIPSDFDINPALDKSTKQILGEAAGVALDVATAGTYGAVSRGIKPAVGFVKGMVQGAKQGAKLGGIFGTLGGGVRAAQEDESVVGGAVSGGVGGVITGGLLGGVLGAISGKLASKAEKTRQLREYALQRSDAIANRTTPPPIPRGVTPEEVAEFEVDAMGKLTTSKTGKAMVDANVNPSYASLINETDEANKVLFKEQFNIAEQASKDVRYTKKPTDIGGKVIIDFIRKIDQKRRNIGAEIGKRIQQMKSDAIDLGRTFVVGKEQVNPYGDFVEDLLENGITISRNGTLLFENSRYANAPAIQNKLQSAFNLIRPDKKGIVLRTPQQIRTARQTLFTDLDLGKRTNELDDTSSYLMKKLYDALDEPLRAIDPVYQRLAKQYAMGTNAIRDFNKLIGKGFEYTDELAPTRAGEISLRQLSNASSNVLQILRGMENAGKELGIKTKVNIRDQALFADFLEDLFGITARTSLQGRVQRGAIQAGEVMQAARDAATGNVTGIIRKGAEVLESLSGTSREQQIEAVRNALFR